MPPALPRMMSGSAPSRRRPLLLLIGSIFLCHVGACDGGLTSSLGAEATYVARAVDDAPLPAPIIQHESYEMILLADTLRFSTSDIAHRVTVHRDTPAGGPSRVNTTRLAERYVIHGDSLRFLRYCPPDAICAGPPTGTFSPDRQHLILQLWYSGPVVAFERIRP